MSNGYEKYQEVIRLYDEEQMTFAEVGEILGVSKQRAHQIYTNAKGRTPRPDPKVVRTPHVPSTDGYNWAKIKRNIDAILKREGG